MSEMLNVYIRLHTITITYTTVPLQVYVVNLK